MDRFLVNYLPPVLRQTKELSSIMSTEQPEVRACWEGCATLLDSMFVQTAGVHGLARFEQMLGILPRASDSLEFRRRRVRMRLNEQIPYTVRTLRSKLVGLCGADGFTLEIEPEVFWVRVKIRIRVKHLLAEAAALCEMMVPANMLVEVGLYYTTYGSLTGFAYEELQSWSCREMWEVDFN